MRRKKLVRPMLLLGLVGVMLGLAQGEVFSQGRGKLPKTRPPIFLNNNASLYTIPNPNFGKPSQLPFSFVAVAHEDCRLYNNGAKIMPKHRMIAAECCIDRDPMTGVCRDVNVNNVGLGQNGVGLLPPCPVPYELVPYLGGLVPWCPTGSILPPVFPPVFNGYNANRMPNASPYVPGGNYANYNPGSSTVTTDGSSASSAQMVNRAYRGFGSYTESNFGGFSAAMTTDPYTRFGRGFGYNQQCCGDKSGEYTPAEADKPAEPEKSAETEK